MSRRSVRCLLGSHYWIGRPPVGIPGGWCWRTCARCDKRAYGSGYRELDTTMPSVVPTPGGIRP